ncbi:MAG: tocopherol cyclase family protein [Chloroflexota bacterium]
MDDFAARAPALESWFWKVYAGPLAFFVDFIVRREVGEAEVRVSLWVDGSGRVERTTSQTWAATQSEVTIGSCQLRPTGSVGAVDDISWDLRWDRGDQRMDTHPGWFGPVRFADLDVTCRPDGLLSGSVNVSGQLFAIDRAHVATYHYWGRRLPDSWCWISASDFEDAPGLRVEAAVASSRLWGRGRLPLGVGYLWWTDGARSKFTLSSVTGLIRHRRDGDSVSIDAVRINGRRHRIRASAPPGTFNHLGEGIRQTLLAELEFDGHRAVPGRVGLEFRGR